MNWWGEIIGHVRRAALTACAASFFTLIAFLIIRSQELQAPAPYQGFWLTLPAVEEGVASLAGDGFVGSPSQQPTESTTLGNFVTGPSLEGGSGMALASTGATSAPEGSSPTDRQVLTVPSELPAGAPIESPSVATSGQGLVRLYGELFAINLESTLLPTDPSSAVVRSGFENLRLYVTHFESNGQIWHRLRMGFFRSEEMARRALAALRSEYPEAWVARTLAEEVLASAGTAIYEPPSSTEHPTQLAESPQNRRASL
jgi:hypothetical protein